MEEINNNPLAYILGEPLHELPKDLYIPPHALEVFLESFTGPLDLLLYLIKKENINILDIPVAEISRQYMEYIEVMRKIHFELAAEYLVMAAMLTEIKSRMLLPKPVNVENNEDDPRAELVRRLREYERYKKAAEDIDSLPRMRRELFPIEVELKEIQWQARPLPKFDLQELFIAFKEVVARTSMYAHHCVAREGLNVRERMSLILSRLQEQKFIGFAQMFDIEEGRLGVVVTFVAILELLRQNLLDIVQTETYGSIYLKLIEVENGEDNVRVDVETNN
jgi:segregation and condensation protein A